MKLSWYVIMLFLHIWQMNTWGKICSLLLLYYDYYDDEIITLRKTILPFTELTNFICQVSTISKLSVIHFRKLKCAVMQSGETEVSTILSFMTNSQQHRCFISMQFSPIHSPFLSLLSSPSVSAVRLLFSLVTPNASLNSPVPTRHGFIKPAGNDQLTTAFSLMPHTLPTWPHKKNISGVSGEACKDTHLINNTHNGLCESIKMHINYLEWMRQSVYGPLVESKWVEEGLIRMM